MPCLVVTALLTTLTLSTAAAAAAAGSADAAAPASAAARSAPASVAAASAAASAETPELIAFRRAIHARYAIKERAFADHDAETIVTQFYTPDVISVGEGEGIYVGRDAIRPLYQDVVKNNHVKIDSVYSFVKGDTGWDWTDFHVQPTDGKTAPFTFVILFLWTKVDGVWMCKGDFFVNGSLRGGKLTPAPAPANAAGQSR